MTKKYEDNQIAVGTHAYAASPALKSYGNTYDLYFENDDSFCDPTSCELKKTCSTDYISSDDQYASIDGSNDMQVYQDEPRGFTQEGCAICTNIQSIEVEQKIRFIQTDQCFEVLEMKETRPVFQQTKPLDWYDKSVKGDWTDLRDSLSEIYFTTDFECPLLSCEVKTKASDCKDDLSPAVFKPVEFVDKDGAKQFKLQWTPQAYGFTEDICMVCEDHLEVEVIAMLNGIKQSSKCKGAFTEDSGNEITDGGISLAYSETDKVYKKAFDQFFVNSVTGCEDTTCELYDMNCMKKLPADDVIYIDSSTDKLTVRLDDPRGFSETSCIKCVDDNSNVAIQKNFKITQPDVC